MRGCFRMNLLQTITGSATMEYFPIPQTNLVIPGILFVLLCFFVYLNNSKTHTIADLKLTIKRLKSKRS